MSAATPAGGGRPSRWTLLWRAPYTYPEILATTALASGLFVVLGVGTGRGISWNWTVVFPAVLGLTAALRLHRRRTRAGGVSPHEDALVRDEMPDLAGINRRLEEKDWRRRRHGPP